jgi:GntR family transcriptional regulator
MYVRTGARAALLRDERERFLRDHWPRIHATIERLGFSSDELLAAPRKEDGR